MNLNVFFSVLNVIITSFYDTAKIDCIFPTYMSKNLKRAFSIDKIKVFQLEEKTL